MKAQRAQVLEKSVQTFKPSMTHRMHDMDPLKLRFYVN